MSSTIEYTVKTTKVCDRCGTETVVDSKVNPGAGEGWLTLHTSQILLDCECFDLCLQCAQDFRGKFMTEKG